MWNVCGKKKNSYRLLVGKPEDNLLEYLSVDGEMLLKWVCKIG
jgi:hypothetical protein